MSTTKVLIVALEFPPVQSTGMFRTFKFLQHLPSNLFKVSVLTLEPQVGLAHINNMQNDALLQQIDTSINVYRFYGNPNAKPFYYKIPILRKFFQHSEAIVNNKEGNYKIIVDQIFEKEKPEVVYFSLPPFSTSVIHAYIVKKYKVKTVVDMRDAWSFWVTQPYFSKWHYNSVLKKENKLLKAADTIISVTPEIVKLFQNTHTDIPKERFVCIPNSISDLPTLLPIEIDFAKQSKVTIGYVGAFYYNPLVTQKKWNHFLSYTPHKENWLYRSPYFFFKAVALLLEKYPSFKNKIKIEFVGHKSDWLIDMIAQFGITENVVLHGFKNKQELQKIQENFDLLLATSEKVENGRHYCLPSKLFEYIQTNKPILALLTEGSQKDFLKDTDMAIICNADDTEANVEVLHNLLTVPQKLVPNQTFLQQYQSSETAQQLAKLLLK